MRYILILVSIIICTSCTNGVPNSKDNTALVDTTGAFTYHNEKIGWSLSVPNAYEVFKPLEKITRYNRSYQGVDSSYIIHLLSFQNNYGNFNSKIEPYNKNELGDYMTYKQSLNTAIYNSYSYTNSDTISGTITIDDVEFYTFSTTLYTDTREVVLHNTIFYTLINGYDFVVSITHQEDNSDGIIKVFFNSTFE